MDRIDAVCCVEPASRGWTRCGPDRSLPLSPELCLAESPPTGMGRSVLTRLVQLGAPAIYWPHAEGEADAEPDLTSIVRKLKSLDAMPDAIRGKRLADMAESGSLLWDAVKFNPYGG